ncbi:hypothetical protein, partial [Pseudomonas aeruginosa]|uniref:hypothetical protein n=1 Tax=Pseudomonas aeruginosa TaxID=287 RepID=UPI001C0B71ED
TEVNGCGGCARMLRLPPGVKEGIPQPACTEAPEIFVICSNAGAVPILMRRWRRARFPEGLWISLWASW